MVFYHYRYYKSYITYVSQWVGFRVWYCYARYHHFILCQFEPYLLEVRWPVADGRSNSETGRSGLPNPFTGCVPTLDQSTGQLVDSLDAICNTILILHYGMLVGGIVTFNLDKFPCLIHHFVQEQSVLILKRSFHSYVVGVQE